jgi:transcriptional regulator with XRE-family HTH domain
VPASWTAVGNAITERLAELAMQQKDLATKSGVSVAAIREIQRGTERRRHPRVLREISVALGWPANRLEDVLQGRQPDEQPPKVGALTDESAAFLAKLAFVLEHRLGQVVEVIYTSDSDVDITIEIRHSPSEH